MHDERSPGGIPIHRHVPVGGGEPAEGDSGLIEAIDAHLSRHIGTPATVYHELISQHVHVDVQIVAPSDDRPLYTLMTCGMSQRPMADGSFAELTIALPATWPAPGSPEFVGRDASWPYTLLQDLARLPHAYETVLWEGHTVPNGDPPERYAPGTALCGALVAPVRLAPEGFDLLRYGDRRIQIFAVVPLHAEEMEVKLELGTSALYHLLETGKVSEILHADRPSLAPRNPPRRRRWFRR